MTARPSVDDLLSAVQGLDPEELDRLIDSALALRAARNAPRLAARKLKLMEAIHRELPPAQEERYRALLERRLDEALTPEEQEELLLLITAAERVAAESLAALVELARLHGVTMDTALEQIESEPTDTL